MDCFLCNEIINFNNARHHFSSDHELFFENGDCFFNFVCINETCSTNFSTFKSFRRHFLNFHLTSNSQSDAGMNREFIDSSMPDSSMPDSSLLNNDMENINFPNMSSIVESFISKIRQKMSISETDFSFLIENFGETVENILNHLNIPDSEVISVKQMFLKSKTFRAQKNMQSNNINTVNPIEGFLGYRTETRIKNGRSILVNVKETFQYIPITKTLINVISNKYYYNLIDSEQLLDEHHPQILRSFTDTKTFKDHPFLKKYPKSIRISLYYDCVEMANIGGSKTGFNNIGLFYFTIQNLPFPFNTQLENIFVLLSCYGRDIKKYGFKKLLKPLK